MDPIARMVAAGAAGVSGSSEPGLYVDEVFSTFLYEGNGSTQSIDNGIDLSGEGGFVWFKGRDLTISHRLYDTERGATKRLSSSLTDAESTGTNDLTAFNSNGFSVGNNGGVNANGYDYVSWTFRKAPGFFDVVTWSGNSATGRQISHNLGSKPGMILIKIINSTYDWVVYHQSEGASKYGQLNSTNEFASASGNYNYFNGTEPTSTHFTVDSGNASARVHVNDFGSTYIAYLFAHDDQSFGTNGDESIIKCGSYTGDGSESGNVINLGFEPQWLMIKRASNTDPWLIWDTMRGMANGVQDPYLRPNASNTEDVFAGVNVLPTGFELASSTGFQNSSGETYIYMAIRRPHKPPTAGTEVFAAQASRDAADGTPSALTYTSNFPVDLMFNIGRAGNSVNMVTVDRLRGQGYLSTALTNAENPSSPWRLDTNAGVYLDGSYGATSDHGGLMFRRAPGFFDVVTYTGNGSSSHSINHNLTVEPELYFVQCRSDGTNKPVFHKSFASGQSTYLNATSVVSNRSEVGSVSSTVFNVNASSQINGSGRTYVAYLFASLDGISKVGSYTGTGSSINVDCGFTAGARFVLIRRTDTIGDWYFWDTARGIVSGNDPYLLFNSTAAEVTNTDYIDPLNAGFTVTSSAPAALNANGGTYLFLAIA